MTNEEKRHAMPEHLVALAKRAGEYRSAKAFEKILQEEDLLKYHGTPVDFIGAPNTHSTNYGNLGNGFYLAKYATLSQKYAQPTGMVKKYVIDPKAKFFEAGKRHSEYLKVWEQVSDKSKSFSSLTEVHDKIRLHLEQQGYAGIKTSKQSIVFDPKAITELPKDFFKEARQAAKTKNSDHELKQPQFVVRHNIRSRSIPGYIKEFERNESLRIHKRKDNVQVYHTILSFSNKDKEEVNEDILRDMSKKYIELRGKDNLYVITAHHDKDHIHLHCAMSGTKLNGLSSRVSRSEFASIKVALDLYQKEKYPQLVHSLPRHGKAKQIESRKEYQNLKRFERTNKDTLLKLLDETYIKATSQEHFLSQLKALGHDPYYRAGKLTGIKYNGERKFRLNRLGFDEKKLFELNITKSKEETALKEIEELRNGRNSRNKDIIRKPSLEDTIKGMNEDEKRKALQESLNTHRAFEIRNKIPETAPINGKETSALQELQDIRKSRGKELGKDHDNDNERDRTTETNDTDGRDLKDSTDDRDSDTHEPDDDKNSEPDADDGDDSDDLPS